MELYKCKISEKSHPTIPGGFFNSGYIVHLKLNYFVKNDGQIFKENLNILCYNKNRGKL